MTKAPRIPTVFVVLLLVPLFLVACGNEVEAPTLDPATHRADVEAFRQQRLAGLVAPGSWLSLAGLFWLAEGENTFGSGEGNDLVFPAPAPESLGTFHFHDGEVELKAAPGVELLVAGEPFEGGPLTSDANGVPTVVEQGSLRFHLIRRQERVGVRLKDLAHPALASFPGVETFPIDPAWRVAARFRIHDPPLTLRVPNVLGTVNDVPSPGYVEMELEGETYRIDAMEGDGDLFLVFGDATNGVDTYGGGRFLYTEPFGTRMTGEMSEVVDDVVIVDFNKAYNPPCAFTPYATCPLPTPENRLALAIPAGEKSFGDGSH